jgi:hypothetical protein
MVRRTRSVAALMTATTLILAVRAWPFPEFARQTKAACAACHASPAGGAELSAAGTAFMKDHKKGPKEAVSGADYVGDNRCQSCHLEQHASWNETRHAHALENLKSAPDSAVAKMASALKIKLKGPAAENDACVACHVTGFKLSGGYPNPDSLRNAGVARVSCESCHGPGSRHVTAPIAMKKKFINGRVSESTCRQCHTAATSPKFAFEDYKKRGVHVLKASE